MSVENQTFDIEVYARIVPALPSGVVVQIPNHEIEFHILAPKDEVEGTFIGVLNVDIVASFAKSSLVVQKSDPDLDTIRNSILNFMEKLLNTYNYIYCRFHVLHLESMLIKRNGELIQNHDYSRLPGWDALEEITKQIRKVDMLFLVNLQASDVQCARAINDLRYALANHYDTAFYSYRAIESIKVVFLDGDGTTREDDARAWEAMRMELRISRQFIMDIKRNADLQRHGRNTPVLAEERLETMRRAWLIVDRYVRYCLQGRSGLGQGYPLLA